MAGPRLGRGRRGLRHRRRLRRPSQLRHGPVGPACWRPRAIAWRSSASPTGTRASPGGRSAGRGSASPSAPATWTRCSTTTRPTARSATTTPTAPAARSAGGPTGPRLAYCQRAREAYKGVPIIAGGVEASLRRLAHYDYWSDKVRRSILLDAKADLVVYGMGERPLVEIVAPAGGRASRSRQLRDIRGVALSAGGASEEAAGGTDRMQRSPSSRHQHRPAQLRRSRGRQAGLCRDDADRSIEETNPHNARRLVQFHGREAVVVNPPAWPLTEAEMDRVYGLPFTRRPHPSYGGSGFRPTRWSRIRSRSCAAVSAAARSARSRPTRAASSKAAAESRCWRKSAGWPTDPDFKGIDQRHRRADGQHVPDELLAGRRCARKCRRLSCLHPTICKLLETDHGPLDRADEAGPAAAGHEAGARGLGHPHGPGPAEPGVHRRAGPAPHGRAVEGRPGAYRSGSAGADEEAADRGRSRPSPRSSAARRPRPARSSYLVPYFIASHPGSDLEAMIDLALYLKRTGYGPTRCRTSFPARSTSPPACTTRAWIR